MSVSNAQTTKPILLTGATGFLGQYLLLECLRRGLSVVVLARRRRMEAPLDRINKIVRFWSRFDGVSYAEPKIVPWDSHSSLVDRLDQSAIDRHWIDRCALVHAAASVRFTADPNSAEPYHTNVLGTAKILDQAGEIGCREFHYVSTAYVNGTTPGDHLESLSRNPGFRNVYEESKYIAEREVLRKRDRFERTLIYRPSIIIGDVASGFAPSFHTIYQSLRLAALIHDERASIESLIHELGVDLAFQKNLVPVDWVARAIIDSVCNEKVRTGIYHLTHSHPTPLREMVSAMLNAASCTAPIWNRIGASVRTTTANIDVKEVFLRSFQSYFSDDPHFRKSSLETVHHLDSAPLLSGEALTRMFRFAIHCEFQNTDAIDNERLLSDLRVCSDPTHSGMEYVR